MYSGSADHLWIMAFGVLCLIAGAAAWHDPSAQDANSAYHCWPGTSGVVSSYGYCPGVTLRWVDPPPKQIKAEVSFNMTYELALDASWYTWAVTKNGFLYNNGTTRTTDAGEAQSYCENTVCPSSSASSSSVLPDNCCVWHVNVHSCPLTSTLSYCGPWISPSGTLYTHSAVLWGPVTQGNWTSNVAGLYVEGATQLIAHFKVGNIQLTLYHDLEVLPKSECGNAICETEDGESCSICPADCGSCPLSLGAILGIVAAGVVVIAAIGAVFGYLQYKQRKLLWDESWIIPYEQIKEDNAVRGFMGSAVSVKASTNSKDMFGGSALAQQAASKQVFCKTGIFNGKTVAVTDIKKVNFALNKNIRVEVKSVRTLDHPNVAKFIGGVITVPNVSICMEYCPKGGLPDILQNDDVPLNWGFRFSFAGDIAKGMTYLHSVGILHGHFKTNNCIVDDRWTVKITDYGLFDYREEEWSPQDPEYEDYENGMTEKQLADKRAKVYRAPETYSGAYTKPTAAADVYAFGIILIEIAARSDPYGDEDPDLVDDDWKPEPPSFEDDDAESEENRCPCPNDYRSLVMSCYNSEPTQRPDFQFVKRTLARINPSQQSPVDMMMQLMEKYSKHLETLVGERTQDLIVEKQKTDRLLYSMMPRKVADDLRMGKQIEAEWFDSCTIYFSDIVGFTSISGKSTPYQVVGLLNKLYTTFDSIIDSYDVYKVETIGDAYMVVSGIPTKNGIRHAHQVACMSIDLVEASKSFVIPHMPDEPMKIRVGLHSGPACAGVVGLKMPRYCLFGDTVNTASRMESNGEAYKVHISNPCHDLLDQIGGFKMELRGVLPIKGKGDMKTWWVLGYDKSAGSPEQLMKEVNQEIDDVIDGKFPQRELTMDPSDDKIYGFDDLFPPKDGETIDDLFSEKSDAQRKISTISTSADSGYNEKTNEDSPESNRLSSPKDNKNASPQRKQASVSGPPPVNV